MIYGLLGVGVEYGAVDLTLYTTVIFVNLLLLCFSLSCLLYYLLYLFTGNKKLLLPVVSLYGLYFFILVYNIVASRPVGIEMNEWRTAFVPLDPSLPPNRSLQLIILVFLAVPQTLAALAYLSLAPKVKDAGARRRIVFVSLSIIAWTTANVLIVLPGSFESDPVQILVRVFGMLAALLGLFAYHPPSWLRKGIPPAPTP